MITIDLKSAGRIGVDGKSAYEIAVQNGFGGSLEDWLESLKEPAQESSRIALAAAANADSAGEKATEAAAYASQQAKYAKETADMLTEDFLNGFPDKADIGRDGYVVPWQLNPLFGRQTGFIPEKNGSQGYFRQRNPGNNKTFGRTIQVVVNVRKFDWGCIFAQLEDEAEEMSGIGLRVNEDGFFAKFFGTEGLISNTGDKFTGDHNLIVTIGEWDEATNQTVLTTYLNGYKSSKILTGKKAYDLSHSKMSLGLGCIEDGDFFRHPIRLLRVFDEVLSPEKIDELWNYGQPLDYELDSKDNCSCEFLPHSFVITSSSTMSRAVDLSGKGNDFEMVGNPTYCYDAPQDMSVRMYDTGVIYSNMSSGIGIEYPAGYAVTEIYISNQNNNNLTDLAVLIWDQEVTIDDFLERDQEFSRLALFPVNNRYVPREDNYLYVRCEGNTASGGMRIKFTCKYFGM